MAAILGETYPELYAAVGVHSGLRGRRRFGPAIGARSDEAGRPQRDRAPSGMPTIVFHGDADAIVHPSNGEQVIAASVGAATAVEIEHRPGSFACTRRVHRTPDDGRVVAEHWLVHGASARMVGRQRARFSHRRPRARRDR